MGMMGCYNCLTLKSTRANIMKSFIKIFLLLCILSTSLATDNFSQWRGPERDGKYPDTKLLQQWPSEGPNLLWTATELGEGFSSPAVTSQGVYVTGMIDGTGYLFAFDQNGKKRWRISYGPEWQDGHDGTRTTPTVVGDKIYIMSGQGKAICVNVADGKIVWKVDLVKSFGARNLKWGMTESLLVDGNRVFCTPGGSGAMMVILDRLSGKTIKVIEGNGEKSAYCSPAIVTHNGKRLLLTMTGESLVGLDAESGDFLWGQNHKTRHDINPNTPLYIDGYIYAVSGYGTGGQLVELTEDGRGIKPVWSDKTLDSQIGAAVVVDDYIYGSGHKNKGWHCIEWRTGNVQFTANDLGSKGNLIFADGLLYCYSEKGDVGLIRPNSKKFDVISSFKIEEGSGSHWAHPVISDGRFYVRHGDVMMVYDIKKN
jgi:outer membrane protein assembly factor BamB